MAQVLILADDMTGTNDTGASIHELGYTVCAVNDAEQPAAHAEGYDCISVNLDSRALKAEKAYQRVYQAAKRFSAEDTKVFSKRIDSTLRGNLGSECDALLDWVPGDPVCFAVPAFPQAGRVYHGDTLFVFGTVLTETAAARDPQCPIRTASAKARFQEQTRRKVCVVSLQEVRRTTEEMIRLLRRRYEEGNRIILLEADTETDIRAAALAAAESGLPFVCADPGPFTAAVVHEKVRAGGFVPVSMPVRRGGAVLAVVGSVNEVSCRQIQVLRSSPGTGVVALDVAQLIMGDRQRIVREAVERVLQQSPLLHTVLLVLSSSLERPEERVDFRRSAGLLGVTAGEVSCMVNDAIADAAVQCLQREPRFGGLFSCGGDISAALFRRMGVNCMRVLEEVIPLAVCAQMENGYYIVTKGGMVGEPDGMRRCIDHLRSHYLTEL